MGNLSYTPLVILYYQNFIEEWLAADGISLTPPSLANTKNVKGKPLNPSICQSNKRFASTTFTP